MTQTTVYDIGRQANRVVPSVPVRRRQSLAWVWGLFVVAHIPFALAMNEFPMLGAAHALVVLAIGLVFASAVRAPDRLLCVVFYIAGAEVLWRMCKVPIIWEFGKYSVIVLLAVSMIRYRKVKPPLMPVLYFACLLPSTVLTFLNSTPDLARQLVSFNLSGPLAVAVNIMYFSRVKFTTTQLRNAFVTFLAPAAAIAYLCVHGVLSQSDIVFNNDSNAALSGGFGPNQVSSILGLGAVLCFFCIVGPRLKASARFAAILGVLLFSAQSALTFSRGGLYCAGAAILVGLWFAVRRAKSRQWVFAGAAVAVLAAQLVIIPRLQSFTGGMLGTRFSDTSPTHRVELVEAELSNWQENPMLGVGPGMMASKRLEDTRTAGHTEISRLLAEHGILGLLGSFILLPGLLRALGRHRTASEKGMVFGLLVWAIIYTMTAAMRLVAPAVMLGLIHARDLSSEVDDGRPGELPAAHQSELVPGERSQRRQAY